MRFHRIVSAVLALVLSLAAAAAPPEWPDTQAAVVAKAFIEAFSSGDVEKLAAFERAYGSPLEEDETHESRAEKMIEIIQMIGALEIHDVMEHDETSVTVRTKSTVAPIWLKLSVALDEANERIAQIQLLPAQAPGQGSDTSWAKGDWTSLEDLLERCVDATSTPAIAACIMQDGSIVEEAAVGRRAVGHDEGVTLEDRFHIGSITKPMTATLVGRLVERGVLSWETTLAEALPDVEMHDAYRDVTVEQLLQHRAGLTRDAERLPAPGNVPPTEARAAAVAQMLQGEPIGPAGADSVYSNAGYGIVAHVAERRAQTPWEVLMRTELFDPLELESAGFGFPAKGDDLSQPHGHFPVEGGYEMDVDQPFKLDVASAPAGDAHCSLRDLARFAHAHLEGLRGNDGVLRAATVQRLHTPLASGGMNYAAGWVIEGAGTDDEVHWHNGSAGSFFAMVRIHVKTGRIVAVATNIGIEGAGIVDDALEAIAKRP